MLAKASELDNITTGEGLTIHICCSSRADKIVWKIHLTKYFQQMSGKYDTYWAFHCLQDFLISAPIGANVKRLDFIPKDLRGAFPGCVASETQTE